MKKTMLILSLVVLYSSGAFADHNKHKDNLKKPGQLEQSQSNTDQSVPTNEPKVTSESGHDDHMNKVHDMHEKCKGDESCKEERRKNREERRRKFLAEKCKGDQKCEAEMKQKFEAKKEKIQAAVGQCADGDRDCKKAARQKMREEFKQKRMEQKKNEEEHTKDAPTTVVP